MWYSRKYNNAPMPYSVFFNGGIATHGTNHISRLGSPASKGCIRLRTHNARRFYNLVSKYGKSRVRIIVKGTTPLGKKRYARKTNRSVRRSSRGARRSRAARQVRAVRRQRVARVRAVRRANQVRRRVVRKQAAGLRYPGAPDYRAVILTDRQPQRVLRLASPSGGAFFCE
ncbi:MAG: L,D-transpeptidase, partial [Pseudomonadota bacterium]